MDAKLEKTLQRLGTGGCRSCKPRCILHSRSRSLSPCRKALSSMPSAHHTERGAITSASSPADALSSTPPTYLVTVIVRVRVRVRIRARVRVRVRVRLSNPHRAVTLTLDRLTPTRTTYHPNWSGVRSARAPPSSARLVKTARLVRLVRTLPG